MKILPVLLAGGTGARLAPLSTPSRPKPFLPFDEAGRSLFEKTLQRVSGNEFLPPLVIGAEHTRFAMHNLAQDAGITLSAILLESTMQGTAYAVALATHFAQGNLALPNDTILLFLPCDHLFSDEGIWRETAVSLARSLRHNDQATNMLGLLGIAMTQPNSELGYMQCNIADNTAPQPVTQFIEKPQNAENYVSSKGWLANCGQFMGSISSFSALFSEAQPKLFTNAKQQVSAVREEYEFWILPEPNSPEQPVSFDVAVLENRAESCVALALSCDWQDLGTIENWCEHTSHTSWQSQCNAPKRVDRPWGYSVVTAQTDTSCVKQLHVYPNRRLSLQRHQHRTEHWRVVNGQATVNLGKNIAQLNAGDTVLIPQMQWHRLANNTNILLIIEETQSGSPDENDIERAADDYGRENLVPKSI